MKGQQTQVTQNQTHRVFKVGLTGGIGTGKTAVSNAFADLGIAIVDTDILAREIVEPGEEAYQEILDYFGDSILNPDRTLNRSALREIVFDDPVARKQLEKITHPRIISRMQALADQCTTPYCILSVPLLFETGLDQQVDRILVVDIPESVQLRRLMQRDAINETQARSIMQTQLDRQSRLAKADDVIDNSGDLTDLKIQVAELHSNYLDMSA